VAKRRGATVIATVSTEAKAELARGAGADTVILYSKEDFVDGVRGATGGAGVHVVYDGVGATTFAKSLDCLRPRGMMVLFGAASGPVPPLDPNELQTKGSVFLTRPSLFHYIAEESELRSRAADVLGWIAAGALKLRVENEYPLARAADAHRALEGRKTTGKALLIP
jgi:NADPH2:quinone reductase